MGHNRVCASYPCVNLVRNNFAQGQHFLMKVYAVFVMLRHGTVTVSFHLDRVTSLGIRLERFSSYKFAIHL